MLTKKVWINYMLAHNKPGLDKDILHNLLEPLPLKELQVLKKNEDLMDRVTEICKMTTVQLIACLRDEYGFEVSDCQNGDLWIDASEVNEKFIPEWLKKVEMPHCGWYVTTDENPSGGVDPFAPWARNLLMQEVRVNGFIRYFKHKLGKATTKKGSNPFEEPGAATGSLSLPWPGSGGNYI